MAPPVSRRKSLIDEKFHWGCMTNSLEMPFRAFRETELAYKSLDAASAQLLNVGLSRKRMLTTESSRQSIA